MSYQEISTVNHPVSETVVSKGRIFWIDFLKLISIAAMIMLHIAAVGMTKYKAGSIDWEISNAFDSICRFCVPVFVMISGTVFLNRSKEIKILKYIKRICISLLFWSIAYSLFAESLNILAGNITILQFCVSIVSPTYLWFLYMIVGIYLIIPLLKPIIDNRATERYFIILWGLFSIFIPAVDEIDCINQFLKPILAQIDIKLILGYSGYFVLGHYLYNEKRKINKMMLVFLMVLAIAFTYFGTSVISRGMAYGVSELFYGYFFPTTFVTSCCIFLLFKEIEWDKICVAGRIRNLITTLAEISLGIYAIHMFFVMGFAKVGLFTINQYAILTLPFLEIVIFLISSCIAIFIKKVIPYGNNIV